MSLDIAPRSESLEIPNLVASCRILSRSARVTAGTFFPEGTEGNYRVFKTTQKVVIQVLPSHYLRQLCSKIETSLSSKIRLTDREYSSSFLISLHNFVGITENVLVMSIFLFLANIAVREAHHVRITRLVYLGKNFLFVEQFQIFLEIEILLQ